MNIDEALKIMGKIKCVYVYMYKDFNQEMLLTSAQSWAEAFKNISFQ